MSEYTTNLNLFKYTSSDFNQVFNFETALNDNWDKIDAAIEEISVDQTFDGTSTKAQSGVAIAGAGFLQVKGAITNSTDLTTLAEGIYTIDGITHSGFPDASQAFYGVLVQYGGDYKPQLLVAGMPSVGGLYHRRYLTASNSFTGWVRCGNSATGSNAFTMGGTPSGYTGGTNVGISSQAKQNYGTAFGFNTNANGNSSTCIGRNAGTSAASAIQIGAGINSTANTLQVGFIHASTNYQLLDGTTGLIPDERISSTIARTSHSQASDTINALTGYVKPSVSSAISAADTLNVALGKLEKAIDSAGSSISITYEV